MLVLDRLFDWIWRQRSRKNRRHPRARRLSHSPFLRNETYTLPNGMKVTLVPYGIIPKAAISIAVDAGDLNEGKNHVGVASLTGGSVQGRHGHAFTLNNWPQKRRAWVAP